LQDSSHKYFGAQHWEAAKFKGWGSQEPKVTCWRQHHAYRGGEGGGCLLSLSGGFAGGGPRGGGGRYKYIYRAEDLPQAAGVTTRLEHDQLLGPKRAKARSNGRGPASGTQHSAGGRHRQIPWPPPYIMPTISVTQFSPPHLRTILYGPALGIVIMAWGRGGGNQHGVQECSGHTG